MHRVTQFYDGKNFYTNLRNYQEQNKVTLSLHYDSLAKWLTNQINENAVFNGVHYYTAVGKFNDDGLVKFLDILTKKDGFFIHKLETVDKQRNCPECNTLFSYQTEKGVDTMMVVDILSMVDSYDSIILLTGDADLVPVVDFLTKLGKKVYVASWNSSDISRKLRNSVFGYINLAEGIPYFANKKADESEPLNLDDEDLEQSFLDAISEAELHFGDGYVGLKHFLNDWRDDRLPKSIEDRKKLLDYLVEQNKVEIYEVDEQNKGLRVVKSAIFSTV